MTATPTPMTLLMLAIFSAMVAAALTYPPAARFMPLTIGIPAIGLCLLQLALDLFRRRTPAAEDAMDASRDSQGKPAPDGPVRFEMPSDSAMFCDTSHTPRERLRREVAVWGAVLGLIAGILLFGFRLTVPVFLIMFLRFQAGASWRRALLFGGAGAVVMYALFERLLKVSLHPGFLTELAFARLGL